MQTKPEESKEAGIWYRMVWKIAGSDTERSTVGLKSDIEKSIVGLQGNAYIYSLIIIKLA